MNKIIVTGCSGFIGSALIEKLRHKYEIIGIDRVSTAKSIQNCRHFYPFDINELHKIKQPIEDVYAVIHLAANPGVRDSHEKFEQVCKDNILGTQRIIDKCISEWKPKKLLIASSSSVYGDEGKDGYALNEYDDVSPRSPYAMSKVSNESLVETYKNCGMLDNIVTICMRFFTVYGPNQRNELAIRAFTDWILRDKPITLYGTGKQVRDFTHIDDICNAMEMLLIDGIKSETYNIGSNDARSINEIIHLICKYTGKNVTINYQPRNRYDVDMTLADIEKIKYDIDWKPEVKFEDGLKEQIEWQKKQLQRN